MSDIKKTPGWIIAEWLRDEGRDDNGLPYYGRLIDMVNRLVTANIEHLKTWRHIDHQNPKESGYVLCCLDGVIKKKWYYSGIEKFGDTHLSEPTEAYYNENVKYWMPMPPRAKDQDSYHEHTDEMISKQIAKAGPPETIVIGETQPTPRGTGREIGKLVLRDIEARIEKGIETYGEPLKAHNGRNALVDAYEEALDLAIYLRQEIEESQ